LLLGQAFEPLAFGFCDFLRQINFSA
jgi:hypothetical protein